MQVTDFPLSRNQREYQTHLETINFREILFSDWHKQ